MALSTPRDPPVSLIGVASELGGQLAGSAGAAAAVRALGVEHRVAGGRARWEDIIDGVQNDGETLPAAIARLCHAVADAVEPVVAGGRRVAVIGGDHSCAVGTWSGAARALRAKGALGMVWIDAHMDSHTPDTTPSGYYHGMPAACLLGYGDPALTGIAGTAPAVAPEHFCIVGARSYEWQEAALLKRLGVRVFLIEEVRRRGLATVLEEAAGIALDGTAGAGVSVDLDALDPADVPAVGSPASGGLGLAELADALRGLAGEPRLVGCEIVELNPTLPGAERTAAAVGTLLAALMGATA